MVTGKTGDPAILEFDRFTCEIIQYFKLLLKNKCGQPPGAFVSKEHYILN